MTVNVTKGEATRRAILDSATALARTMGLGGLTIGKLAEEMKLSKSGLFAHFRSKENLQLEVIQHARQEFVDQVVAPALRVTRGEPRLRALLTNWLAWAEKPGGCVFVAATAELDDREGPVRDAVAAAVRDAYDMLAHAARIASEEGHLERDLDVSDFAFELHGIMLECHMHIRLLRNPQAKERAWRAFEALVDRSRPVPKS